jgi:transcriptional regulator
MSVYVPPAFSPRERASVARLLHDHPFATLVTPGAGEPLISHLPLLHVADREPHGTLLGHFARANPHWREAQRCDSIAVFHGPHAYVSPSWYAEPELAVPTWNYATVHVHGTVEVVDEPAGARSILDALIHRFEAGREVPWELRMDAARRDALVAAIVAFRIRIRHVEAKFKLSQNRPVADRARVAAALEGEGHADATATAAWMLAYGGARDHEPS